jgi:DNA-directed RNA polymerase subunit E'/Rpb7
MKRTLVYVVNRGEVVQGSVAHFRTTKFGKVRVKIGAGQLFERTLDFAPEEVHLKQSAALRELVRDRTVELRCAVQWQKRDARNHAAKVAAATRKLKAAQKAVRRGR